MQPTLKLILVLLLGSWLGASVFFSFVSAPALFQLARSQVITREQAGDIAGALLKRYFVCGIVVLVLALALSALLAFATARPRFTKCAIVLVVLVAITAFDGFIWSPRVHQIRETRRAHPSAELDRQFGRAHGISFGLNFLVILGTAAAFMLAAKPDEP